MSWREQLRPASFRGVAFHAVSGSASFGRRTVLHDYPFRDLPFAEDLGRKAREMTVVGFVVGADYMTGRDALIAAAEQAGPGKLVHPYYGELTVSVTGGLQVDESTGEGGIARVTFTCTESGEAKFPSAQAATQDVLSGRCELGRDALASSFAARFDIAGLPGWAVTDALDRAGDFLTVVETALDNVAGVTGRGTVLGLINALSPELASLLREPLQLARRISAIAVALRGAMPARSAHRAFAGMATFGADDAQVPATTPSRQREAANRVAFLELAHGTAAVEAAASLGAINYTDYDGAVRLRDTTVEQIDAVADATPDDDLFNSLTAVRAAVVRDVAARGANLARIVRITPPTTLPALVLAYNLFDDATRDGALVDRNRITHPGFVPGGAVLEVPVDA